MLLSIKKRKKKHSENEDRLDTKPSVSFSTIWLKPILEIEACDGLLKIIILEYCQTFLQTSLAAFIQNNRYN